MRKSVNNAVLSTPMVRSSVQHSGPIVDGSVLTQLLSVPTDHARELTVGLTSNQPVTVFIRRWFASRTIVVDSAGTAIAASTPIVITAANLGDEAALLITNASGFVATITAQMLARS